MEGTRAEKARVNVLVLNIGHFALHEQGCGFNQPHSLSIFAFISLSLREGGREGGGDGGREYVYVCMRSRKKARRTGGKC